MLRLPVFMRLFRSICCNGGDLQALNRWDGEQTQECHIGADRDHDWQNSLPPWYHGFQDRREPEGNKERQLVNLHQILFTAKKPGSPVLDNVQLRKLRVIDLVQTENNPGAEGTFVWVSIKLTSSSALPLAPGLGTHLYLRPCANKRCFAAVSWLPVILHTR